MLQAQSVNVNCKSAISEYMTYNAMLLAKNCIDDAFQNVFLWRGRFQVCHQSVCFCYVICTNTKQKQHIYSGSVNCTALTEQHSQTVCFEITDITSRTSTESINVYQNSGQAPAAEKNSSNSRVIPSQYDN